MGLALPKLRNVQGLDFCKLVGSGKGIGFSLIPDWSRYGILAVWKSEEDAERFYTESTLIATYRKHAEESFTLKMVPFQSHGKWSGENPFSGTIGKPDAGPVAVLTRAKIRWSKLRQFWKHVPAASKSLEEAPGLICSFGIGEAPFVLQATISVWESLESVKEFAYSQRTHREVVKKTRDEDWYAEDLFARFIPIEVEGTTNGINPLKDKP